MSESNKTSSAALVSSYAVWEKIYPREVKGRFATLRNLAVIALLGIYYLLPWLKFGGDQAILFDLPNRKFHIFALSFWPQDFVYMAWLLIIAALSLFFFTAMLGRIWCGFACPQTVWTEAFLWMERITEGSHTRRRKLDKAPMSVEKILRKTAKQFLWVGFSLWTGITFVAYFNPASELFDQIASFQLGPWETFWCLFYSFATYGNAGFLREQVCKYMCPYARFQSAMFDKDTLIISYDEARGDPRGRRKRSVDPREKGLGDCIDCKLCVQVCPTGIDIREGLQYECIACAACIDVCDSVMERMDYPKGLIRYTSEDSMVNKQPLRILRPRVLVYGALLLCLVIGFVLSIGARTPLRIDALRDRNTLYRELSGGEIENVFSLKVLNLDTVDHSYLISVEGIPGIRMDSDTEELVLEAGEVGRLVVRVRVDKGAMADSGGDILFRVQARSDPSMSDETNARFIGPSAGP